MCPSHGGRAPQVKAKARERLALAEALATYPQKSAPEVLMYAMHLSDVITQWEAAAPDDIEVLLHAVELSARLAKTAMDTGVQERLTRMFEQTASRFLVMTEEILDGLDLTPEQARRVPGLITAELEAITGREIEAGPGRPDLD